MDNATLKEILLTVYQIDQIVNKFHNKVSFLNLNHLMGRVGTWDEEKKLKVLESIQAVHEELKNVSDVVDSLEEPGLALINSYAIEN